MANVSRAFWIPTIWMLYAASKPLGIWFGSRGGDVESGSVLDQVFLFWQEEKLIGPAPLMKISG
jgi:hypothetical protein